MNVRLDIEYDGAAFNGWQRQEGAPTVQAAIEDILQNVLGRRTVLYGAGRTDSGVHARGQVANFYADTDVPPERWKAMLNYYLPPEIRILEARSVPESFHSQKDAISKIYEYRVLNRSVASALDRRVLFYPAKLDWDKIRSALPLFVGEKDFRAFQGAKASVRTTVRRVIRFDLHSDGLGLYRFEVEGTGFLKQMVRSMVGTVLEVGEGRRELHEVVSLFQTGDRRQAGRTVPAHGLCLVKVRYPEE